MKATRMSVNSDSLNLMLNSGSKSQMSKSFVMMKSQYQNKDYFKSPLINILNKQFNDQQNRQTSTSMTRRSHM